MKKSLLLALCILLYQSLPAQDIGHVKRRAKAVYLEAMGMSEWGLSLNYDMRLKKGRNDGWGFRAGGGYDESPGYAYRYQYYYLPVMLNKVTGNRRIALETGIGTTLSLTRWRYDIGTFTGQPGREHTFQYRLYANIGLRLQPLRKGVLFRLYWSPVFQPEGKISPYWAGASIGFAFK